MATLPKPEINPKEIRLTKEFKRHKKQRFWHIYFPMILTTLVLAAMMTLVIIAITQNPDMNSKWASLILMVFIVVASLFTTVIAAILIYIAIYLGKGINAAPTYTNMAKFYTNFITSKLKEYSDKLTQPIIKTAGWSQGARTLFQLNKIKTDKNTKL